MASVHDVAAYIVEQSGPMSAMKLQKLVYYSQAWHLVWDDEALFDEAIQAWANGPVVYELFDQHRGQFTVSAWSAGDSSALAQNERETIDAVIRDYGSMTARQLSFLTHSEDPWKDARGNLSPTARSSRTITQAALAEFYGALDASEDAQDVDDLDWDEWLASED